MSGGSLGKSSSKSKSKQDVWGGQSPYLTDIYSNAQSLYQQSPTDLTNASNSINQWVGGQGNDVIGGTVDAYGNMIGGNNAAGNMANATYGGASNALNQFLQGPQQNPYLQQSVQGALGDMATVFNREVMPGIRGEGMMAGQPGSSRQGIAEGIALGDLSRNMLNTASGMYGDAYTLGQNQQLQAAQTAGNWAGQAGQQQLGAMGQAGNLYNLGLQPANAYQSAYNMQWQPLQNYSNIIGSPTVLGRSSSNSGSMNLGFGG